MKTKTFEDILTRNATREDFKDLIKLADQEIEEWQDFKAKCEKEIKCKHNKMNKPRDYKEYCDCGAQHETIDGSYACTEECLSVYLLENPKREKEYIELKDSIKDQDE